MSHLKHEAFVNLSLRQRIKLHQNHLKKVKALHEKDLSEGYGDVYLPYALERKYPSANKEWGWQIRISSKQTFRRSQIRQN